MLDNEITSTLVLFDWKGELDCQCWLRLARDFFGMLGETINDASYSHGRSKERTISPRSVDRMIRKPDIDSMALGAHPAPVDYPNRYTAYASFTVDSRNKTAIFSYIKPSIDVKLFSTLIERFSEAAEVTYGIGYRRVMDDGPVFFAYDIGVSHPFRKTNLHEEKEMMLWRYERMDLIVQKKLAPFRHLEGMQRDVFTLNVLTRPHIEREVEGQRLGDWIAADPDHGYFKEIADGVWVWALQRDQRPRIREVLRANGLLIASIPDDAA